MHRAARSGKICASAAHSQLCARAGVFGRWMYISELSIYWRFGGVEGSDMQKSVKWPVGKLWVHAEEREYNYWDYGFAKETDWIFWVVDWPKLPIVVGLSSSHRREFPLLFRQRWPTVQESTAWQTLLHPIYREYTVKVSKCENSDYLSGWG